uniref:Uncharacterized protein n=1 Tax=Ammopiptanthus mongolicus TaxID=126911 RepID=A0A385G272_AMMMO|nr:hypothetical protein [Ammopiptanthus mongolicus]AXV54299.1 hypothetical protein [Ammopiptanthus mongolicus]
MDRRAQPDPVQFVFCGNTTVQVQGKRKESVTLCFAFFPLNLLACLVEVSRVSTADRIVMKRSLFRSSTKKGIVTTTKFARGRAGSEGSFSRKQAPLFEASPHQRKPLHASLFYRVPNLRTPKLQASFEAPTFLIDCWDIRRSAGNPIKEKKGAFPQPIYTTRALPPSIESSNSLSEILPPRISCHASCFSESVPSVSQSRFAIKRGNLTLVSTAFSRPSTERCTMLIGIGKDLLNRCRVPLFPVRESPSALTGRARILMSAHAQNSSDTSPSRCAAGSVKRFGFSVGSRSPAPPHSPLVGRVVNLEGARLLFRRVFDNLAVVRSPLLEAGVLGRWGFLFLNQFGCVSPEIGWSNIYELAGQRWMEVPCCSPLPEAKDGVEPSFQDLQSDTFPLCYPAKPATSCAKVKRLFFLPRSLFFYICGGGRSTLYDRRRVTREEGITSFSLALLHFPFLIESSKPLHYWYRGQKREGCSSSPADPLFMRQCDAAEKRKPLGSKISLSPLLPVSILVDSLLPSRKRLAKVGLLFIYSDILPLSDRFRSSEVVDKERTRHRAIPSIWSIHFRETLLYSFALALPYEGDRSVTCKKIWNFLQSELLGRLGLGTGLLERICEQQI